MTEGIKKFVELMNTDEAFRTKLKAAAESYNSEKTEEAIFNNVLVPVAAEYGISVPYEEYHEFISKSQDQPLNENEVLQIAGGKPDAGGLGATVCVAIGAGIGGAAGKKSGGICVVVGAGWDKTICAGSGISEPAAEPARCGEGPGM